MYHLDSSKWRQYAIVGATAAVSCAAAAAFFLRRPALQTEIRNEQTRLQSRTTITSSALGPHKGWVSAVAAVDPSRNNGVVAATGGYDMSMRLWKIDLSSPDGLSVVCGAGCSNSVRSLACFDWDGSDTIVTGQSAFGGATTEFFDANTAEPVAAVRGHSMAVLDVAILPKSSHHGIMLASCSPDQSVRLYDLGSRNKESLNESTSLEYSSRLLSVSFCPQVENSTHIPLMVVGSLDCRVLLVNQMNKFVPIGSTEEGHSGPVTRVRFDPLNGKNVVSVGHDGCICLWDIQANRCVSKAEIASTSISTMAISASPSTATLFITGSQDGMVRVWDPRTLQEPVQTHSGHSDFVLSVALNADCTFAFSGGKDRTFRMWDLRR